MKTILLVDDKDDSRIATSWFLTNFGYLVDSAPSAQVALALFDPKIHAVVVTDNSMPGMSGMEMAQVIKLRSPSTPVLMYTGLAPDDESCVDLVIQRPAHMLALKEGVDGLLVRQER
jgi:CheY-like chemotaxis protein